MEWYKSILVLFVAVFTLTSATGLAKLLVSRREITPRNLAGVMLYNGLMGLAISLIYFQWGGKQPSAVWSALGFAILVGLSGIEAVDVVAWIGHRIGIGTNGKRQSK